MGYHTFGGKNLAAAATFNSFFVFQEKVQSKVFLIAVLCKTKKLFQFGKRKF